MEHLPTRGVIMIDFKSQYSGLRYSNGSLIQWRQFGPLSTLQWCDFYVKVIMTSSSKHGSFTAFEVFSGDRKEGGQ